MHDSGSTMGYGSDSSTIGSGPAASPAPPQQQQQKHQALQGAEASAVASACCPDWDEAPGDEHLQSESQYQSRTGAQDGGVTAAPEVVRCR
jgi:hypothetical protein